MAAPAELLPVAGAKRRLTEDRYFVKGVALPLKQLQSDAGNPSDGSYYLSEVSREVAFLGFHKDAIKVPSADFEELWTYGQEKVSKPAKFDRINATFGGVYSFGSRSSEAHLVGREDEWPEAVKRAIADARARSCGVAFTSVHVNWYDGGNTTLQMHSDDMTPIVANSPIFSYTLLGNSALPREFFIGDKSCRPVPKDNAGVLYVLEPRHGDLIIMAGRFQEYFKHGVPQMAEGLHKKGKSRRINLTVRCFRDHHGGADFDSKDDAAPTKKAKLGGEDEDEDEDED